MSDPPGVGPPRFWARLGLRSEIRILLPVATLVLVVLSAFTLLSYRGALRQIAEERRSDAARMARDLSTAAAEQIPSASTLSRIAPFALGAAIGDERGGVLARSGDLQDENLLAPLGGHFPEFATAVGPSPELRGTVAGFAPFGKAGARRVLRIDLAAPGLDAQTRALSVLLWVVVPIDAALALLMILFLRYALRPYDALVAKARAAGDTSAGADEINSLIATFERGLAALVREADAPVADDIAALERALAPSLESGLLLLDRVGGVLALNSTGERLLGIPTPSAGTALAEALAPHPGLLAQIRDALGKSRGLQRAECSIDLPTSAGGGAAESGGASPPTRRLLGLTVHPLRRDDGALRGFLVLFADLTEIRRHEEESRLAESLTRIGELAAGIAHELRNSLATLRGYLTLIERGPGADAVEDYLGEIRHETDHLQRVLDDFLMFARPGSVRLEEMNLETVVRRAALDPALGGAKVALDLDTTGETLLRGDPQLIERAIRNLLHNAVEATSEAAEGAASAEPIVARVRRAGDEIVLEVEDRGKGIPESMRDRLFHPFATARSGGVGLGLALTRRIVDLHGGTIRVEPRPGGGTRARLSLPVAAPSPPAPSI